MKMPTTRYVLCLVSAILLLPACSASPDDVRPDTEDAVTISVPEDASTIQKAVDAARPGDTVEIGPGTYGESVAVATDDLRIRGTDRNDVVIDGSDIKSNGIVVTSDRVVVENLTVQNFTLNGVLVTGMSDETGGLARGSDGYERLDPEQFPPVSGFAVRYVTATNNGLYGIYAFDSQDGMIANNYASGSSDSGIYVGQCIECNIAVHGNVAEYNAVGYEHTNASDSVVVAGNRFSSNRIGVTLLSDYQEAFIPLSGVNLTGNVIVDNAAADTPAHAEGGFGIGVGISGAQDIDLDANLIAGHPRAGVEITSTEDLPPTGTSMTQNSFTDNRFDLVYAASERAPGSGNCIEGEIGETYPGDLAATWTCPEGSPEAPGADAPPIEVPEGISYRDVPKPDALPSVPADDDFDVTDAPSIDLDQYGLPDESLLLELTQSKK